MKRCTIQVVNVDEDVAEKALEKAVDALSRLVSTVTFKEKSITVDPHDDYRGIYASFDYEFTLKEGNESKNASRAMQDTVQDLIKLQLWNVPQARVITESSTIK
jgi:hypothetical protein